MEETVTREEVENWLERASQNSYPSKIELVYTLCNNSKNSSIAMVTIVNEKALTALDVREAILTEEAKWKSSSLDHLKIASTLPHTTLEELIATAERIKEYLG